MRRAACLIALVLSVASAFGQDERTVKITFPSEGERQIWFGTLGEFSAPDTPISSIGLAVQLPVPDDAMSKWIFVHTVTSGDVAVRKADDALEEGTWEISAEEFNRQYLMEIRLEHDGLPVASAIVELSAAGERRITAAPNGRAQFYTVPFGKVELRVQYESEGEDQSLVQTLIAKASSAGASVRLLQIADPVETVAPDVAEEDAGDEEAVAETEEAEAGGASFFASLVKMLIGLGVVVAIGYFIIQYLKKNSDQAQEGLAKLGITVPGSGGDPAPSAPVAPAKPKQIILGGDAAPQPVASTPPVAQTVKNPRLVKADGSILMVADGEQTVGRDDSADMVVTGESSVSRKHASLSREGDTVSINDLGSSNGTFVNGKRINAQQTLKPGDTVQFGGAQYRYEE